MLSFRDSDLMSLPKELETLTSLKLLDLHGCRDLELIPANLLSKLTKLEHLFMRKTEKFVWNRGGSACLSELESMQQLLCIEIDIQCGMAMPENINYNKLERFYIDQSGEDDTNVNYKCKLILQNLPQGNSNILLKRAEWIGLKEVTSHRKVLFDVEPHGFENLTEIHFHGCEKMQYLFSLSIAERLLKLRILKVCDSSTIEGIVYEDYDRKNTDLPVEFSNLVELELVNLPQLSCFVKTSNVSECCQLPFFHKEVMVPQLEQLTMNGLPKIEYIWSNQLEPAYMSKLKMFKIDAGENVRVCL